MKLLIGVIGEKGSGKGTFAALYRELSKKPIACIKSSDVLAETLKLWHMPLTRANLQNLAIYMDGGFGNGTLSHAVRERIAVAAEDVVIFEGIRWPTDVDLVRSFPGNILVSITASPDIRFERLKKRKEKIGEGEMNHEQFMQEEQAKTEVYIADLAAKADIKIDNSGDEAALRRSVEAFIKSRT
jgi:dephospho-CoA kinase